MNAAIIARNTRNGHTAWQHVAAQLGRSVDSVRAQFDPSYMRAHIWAPSREPQPEMIPDENDTHAPHPKGAGLKCQIIAYLNRRPATAETIAAWLAKTPESIRVRLNALKADKLVEHDGFRLPYVWSLTAAGRLKVAAGQRNASGGEVAA